MENLLDNNPNKQTPVPERAAVHASTLTDQVNSLNNVSSDDKTRGECELNVFPTTCCCSYCSPARVTACAWHHRGYTSVFSANAGCYCTPAPASVCLVYVSFQTCSCQEGFLAGSSKCNVKRFCPLTPTPWSSAGV